MRMEIGLRVTPTYTSLSSITSGFDQHADVNHVVHDDHMKQQIFRNIKVIYLIFDHIYDIFDI